MSFNYGMYSERPGVFYSYLRIVIQSRDFLRIRFVSTDSCFHELESYLQYL